MHACLNIKQRFELCNCFSLLFCLFCFITFWNSVLKSHWRDQRIMQYTKTVIQGVSHIFFFSIFLSRNSWFKKGHNLNYHVAHITFLFLWADMLKISQNWTDSVQSVYHYTFHHIFFISYNRFLQLLKIFSKLMHQLRPCLLYNYYMYIYNLITFMIICIGVINYQIYCIINIWLYTPVTSYRKSANITEKVPILQKKCKYYRKKCPCTEKVPILQKKCIPVFYREN